MNTTARLYLCALCHKHCVICSACDHGNIYCFDGCADIARKESCRAANQRYQNTFQGKSKHADRQRRYREGLKQKVTDHGSTPNPKNALLYSVENEADIAVLPQDFTQYHCCCCHQAVPSYFRRHFIQQSRRKNTKAANTS